MRTSTKWQRFRSHARPFVLANATPSVLPNMRLKLPGGDRSKGTGVLCAGAHELSFNYTAPCGRVARSLSARSEEHTSELQSRLHLVCRLLLEKKKPATYKHGSTKS